MMVDSESAGRQTTQIPGATRNVVHAATGGALEVMVMRGFPHLVAGTLCRQRNDLDSPLSHKQLEIAIDRCHAQRRHTGARSFQHFAGGEGSLRDPDGRLDGVALSGCPFHGTHWTVG